ncbi:hypothetical protein SAMN04489859_103042 [Paracoccus alcaliphilus]|uniref:GpW protein n=1 Tax=Paracoccus alcaliphilus TaxID=34002 RepID=A0A1H8LH88_9RHOB|nr:hypothetical protein [Paracoccus alcaliphilus]WCR18543.1 hypothetical protein JHW40_01920 [Paracoccus alcaliphilus]SEO04156.1 hypothetical protein SAMN04489859_103042 [Paracoccus alcaliphilus]
MADLSALRRYRDDLQDARYSGIRSTRDSNGEEVHFKSDAEMARALADIDSQIAALTRRRNSIVYLQTSKGV